MSRLFVKVPGSVSFFKEYYEKEYSLKKGVLLPVSLFSLIIAISLENDFIIGLILKFSQAKM